MNDVVVGRGAVYEEKVLVPESAALEALRVVDLLIQSDDRRQVVKLEVGKGKSVRYCTQKAKNPIYSSSNKTFLNFVTIVFLFLQRSASPCL